MSFSIGRATRERDRLSSRHITPLRDPKRGIDLRLHRLRAGPPLTRTAVGGSHGGEALIFYIQPAGRAMKDGARRGDRSGVVC
jgi:hypothetical protein